MKVLKTIRSDRLLWQSALLLFLLLVLLSIVLWRSLSAQNELNHNRQQEIVQRQMESFSRDIEHSMLSIDLLFESSNIVTEEEFDIFTSSLLDSNSIYNTIYYIEQSEITYAVPIAIKEDLIGQDVIASFSPSDIELLQEAIESQTTMYRFTDDNEEIVLYKPIIIDDTYSGIIAVSINQNIFATVFNGLVEEGDVIFRIDDHTFIGENIARTKNFEFTSIDMNGIEFSGGTTYFSSEFQIILRWGAILEITTLGAFIFIFALLYRYQKRHTDYVKRMGFMQYHHFDTGLRNVQSLYRDFLRIQEQSSSFYLAYAKFNNIKFIHYKYGRDIGDSIELNAIRLIEGVLRENSTIYHLGGDEYIFLFDSDKKAEVTNILNRILRLFEREMVVKDIRTNISISIAVLQYPLEGKTVEELIQNANITLAQSSIQGSNNYTFHSSNLDELVSLQEMDLMISQMGASQYKLVLMPIANCSDNQIVGYECLTRAYNGFGDLLPTQLVITSLERSGHIQELDTMVFSRVLELKKQFDRDEPSNNVFFSVNASALSLNQEFVDNIIDLYEQSKLPHESIVLELTESYKVEDSDYLIRLFKQLNTIGIKTSIDDFGSGYSSLSYLSKFPVYSIKLDKSYVRDFDTNQFNRTLFLTMKSIATVLKCDLIAEGVDDSNTLTFLHNQGCPMYQGFLLSKGVPYKDALAIYKKAKNTTKE